MYSTFAREFIICFDITYNIFCLFTNCSSYSASSKRLFWLLFFLSEYSITNTLSAYCMWAQNWNEMMAGWNEDVFAFLGSPIFQLPLMILLGILFSNLYYIHSIAILLHQWNKKYSSSSAQYFHSSYSRTRLHERVHPALHAGGSHRRVRALMGPRRRPTLRLHSPQRCAPPLLLSSQYAARKICFNFFFAIGS